MIICGNKNKFAGQLESLWLSAVLIKIIFETPAGEVREATSATGHTLLDAALENRIPGIIGDCGGCCACATCHVTIPDEWFQRVGPPNAMEDVTLYMRARRYKTSRLACQIVLTTGLDGLRVKVSDG